MRSRFDTQLEELNKEMITMGMLCETAIAKVAHALTKGDLTLAKTLPELAVQIKHKERDIENRCLRLLLRQQPVAQDLRTVSSALKMITDMERIGDQSSDIADIVLAAEITEAGKDLPVSAMAEAVIKMVTESIDAFVKKDANTARSVIKYDDVVDEAFLTVKTALIRQLNQSQTDGEYALDLLMIAKYFERIGDHAVNIAKWVLFSITGNHDSDEPVDDTVSNEFDD